VDGGRGCGGRAASIAVAVGPACARARRRPLFRSACGPCTRDACAGGRTIRCACDCARICPRARARAPPCRCACGRAPLCRSGSAVCPYRLACTCARDSHAAALLWAPR